LLELIRKKGSWLANAIFFAICLASGMNYHIGLTAVVCLVLAGFLIWVTTQATDYHIAIVALSIALFARVLDAPITSGGIIYYIQNGLAVFVMFGIFLSRPSSWPSFIVLFPVLIFTGVLFPFSLTRMPIDSIVVGWLRWLHPLVMFFIAERIYHKGMEKLALNILILSIIVQIPIAPIIGSIHSGSFMVFRHADFLSGTFGTGGTTTMAVLFPPTVIWALWAAWYGYIKKTTALAALVGLAILVGLCEIKYVIVLTPALLVLLNMVDVVSKKDLGSAVARVMLFIIPAVLVGMLVSVSDQWLTYRSGSGFSSGVNIFDMRNVENYLSTSTGGSKWTYKRGKWQKVLTRYGTTRAAVIEAGKSPVTLLLGHGLNSSMDYKSQASLLRKITGATYVAYQFFTQLLFEGGIIGIACYLVPVLYFFIVSIRTIFSPIPGVSPMIATGVLLFTFTAIISILYNHTLRVMPFGGTLWFLCGILSAQMRQSNWEQ
jgi:hypothetical protein